MGRTYREHSWAVYPKAPCAGRSGGGLRGGDKRLRIWAFRRPDRATLAGVAIAQQDQAKGIGAADRGSQHQDQPGTARDQVWPFRNGAQRGFRCFRLRGPGFRRRGAVGVRSHPGRGSVGAANPLTPIAATVSSIRSGRSGLISTYPAERRKKRDRDKPEHTIGGNPDRPDRDS